MPDSEVATRQQPAGPDTDGSPHSSTRTWERLEGQIAYYDTASLRAQRWFRHLKVLEVTLAAAIPFLVGIGQQLPTALAGILIVVIEGLQALGQYHQNWLTYRSTCEDLRHEKYLFLAGAGPYASPDTPLKLLAERVESLVSQEHAKWVSARETATPPSSRGERR